MGPASCRWHSLATAWEKSEQGFPRVRPRPLPQVRGSYLKELLTHIHFFVVHKAMYSSPLQVKNKSHDEATNVPLFLGLLAWLQTVYC